MKIITIAHQKGGVGKSTLAINLAHAFKDNVPTAVIDLDPQGSIIQSASKVKGIEILPWKKNTLEKLGDYFVFIDTPPYLSDKLADIFKISDLIIIPTKAGIYDVLACRRTVSLVKKAQKINKGLKAGIVLNQVNKTTTLTDEAKEALQNLEVPILKAQISERMNFIRSVALPDGIYSTKDNKAINELNELTKETLFLLQ